MTRTTALLLVVVGLAAASTATAAFICNATTSATCRSLVAFHPSTTTTYGAVAGLFQVDLPSLLGANDLPADTPSVGAVQSGARVLIPIRCRCSNGTGRSDGTPIYTVQDGDVGLLNITVAWFGNLTTYQEIAEVNRLPDANVIQVGQSLWIPLPCSCDEVGGEETVHLAHVVAPGSSVDAIAAEFGTTPETIIALNGNLDPSLLQAYQVLDVPLRACSSSIFNSSLDYGLRLANHSYALTAGGCVTCSCSAATYRLECAQLERSLCPSPVTCGPNVFIGDTTPTSGCAANTCAYAGYTNSSSGVVTISAVNATVTRTDCNDGGTDAGGGASMKGINWSGVALLVLHIVYVYFQ
ncbi:chitin elicitor-binding protein-like [Curcuma longa]|uniref:chitin elicitor-binding protein-like n=1 Tax=Curcuma longa TaxID=136217 RepID=UPI003D9EBCF6